MFDVGFQELALIFGVSLLVLGPKRLPGLVSKVGRWVGKARMMARDFRQQLENEVNLEELNRITDVQTRQSRGSTMPEPAPPFSGETPPETSPTYPYSSHDVASPADSPAAADTSFADGSSTDASPAESPQTDDTYSHAHAAGDAPMPDVQEHAWESVPHGDEPVQADLDLSTPDDHSHLPPDDARRYT
jgi:sec-independent protein translocase protein TatB